MAHKFPTHDLQDDYEERAAILQFDAKLPRAIAEKEAYEQIMLKLEKGNPDNEILR